MSWFAAVFTLTGLVLSAKKIRWCWVLFILGSTVWITYGVRTHQWSIVMLDAGAIGFNVYGWRQWGKEGKTCQSTVSCARRADTARTIFVVSTIEMTRPPAPSVPPIGTMREITAPPPSYVGI